MWNVKTWITLVWLVGSLVSIPSTLFGVTEHEEGTPTEESSTEIREAARQKIVEVKPPISALLQISKGLAETDMSKEAFTKLVDRTQGLEKKQRDAIIGSFQEVSSRLGSTGKKKLREEFAKVVNNALGDLEKSLTEPPAKTQPDNKTADAKQGQGNPLDPKASKGDQSDLAKVVEKLLQQSEDPSLRGREAQRELLRNLLAQNAAKNGKGEGGGGGGNGNGGGGRAGGDGAAPGGDKNASNRNNGADKIAKAIEKAGHDDKKEPQKRTSSNSNDSNNNSEKKSSSDENRSRNSDGNSNSSREALASLLDDKEDKNKEEPKTKKEKPDVDKLLGLSDKSKQEEAPAKSIPSFLLGGKEPLSPAPPNQSLALSAPDLGGGGGAAGAAGGSSGLAGTMTASPQGGGAAVSGDLPPLQEPAYPAQAGAGTVFERAGIYQNAGSSGGGGSADSDADENTVDTTTSDKLKALGPSPRTVVVRENLPSRWHGRDRTDVRKGSILERNKGNLIGDMCSTNPGNSFCFGRSIPSEDRTPGSNSQLGGLPS